MKFLMLLTVFSIALAIAEANEAKWRGGLGRHQGSRFVRPKRPLSVLLVKPEQSTESTQKPIETTLILKIVNNPIEDIGELLSNGLVGNADFQIDPIKSVVNKPSEGKLPMPFLEKPEQSTEPVTSSPPVEDTLIQNIVNNPIEDIAVLPTNGLVGIPDVPIDSSVRENEREHDVQIDPIFVPIFRERDLEYPLMETFEFAEKTLIESVVKNPIEEVIENSKGKLPFNQILRIPAVLIKPSVVPMASEPDVQINPIIDTFGPAKKTLIASDVKLPEMKILENSTRSTNT